MKTEKKILLGAWTRGISTLTINSWCIQNHSARVYCLSAVHTDLLCVLRGLTYTGNKFLAVKDLNLSRNWSPHINRIRRHRSEWSQRKTGTSKVPRCCGETEWQLAQNDRTGCQDEGSPFTHCYILDVKPSPQKHVYWSLLVGLLGRDQLQEWWPQ